MKEDLIYALRLTIDENTVNLGIKWILENQIEIKNFLFYHEIILEIMQFPNYLDIIFNCYLPFYPWILVPSHKTPITSDISYLIKHLENVS